MSTDYLVRFDDKPVPPREDVGKLCEDFVGVAGTVRWVGEQSRFYVDLVGTYSDPLQRFGDPFDRAQKAFSTYADGRVRPRWIEVWIGKDNIDVMTRSADDFTMAIANAIADKIARFWDGRFVPPS